MRSRRRCGPGSSRSPPAANAPTPSTRTGLRATVSAALEHGLSALECSEDRAPQVPPILLAQARLAVRGGVSLDTVLRRYFVGYTLLGDFVIEEAERSGLLKGAELQQLLRAQAALFDRVIAAVSEEYAREEQGAPPNAGQRRAERVKRLLAGDLLDASDLGYDFDASHLGVLAVGPGASETLEEAASRSHSSATEGWPAGDAAGLLRRRAQRLLGRGGARGQPPHRQQSPANHRGADRPLADHDIGGDGGGAAPGRAARADRPTAAQIGSSCRRVSAGWHGTHLSPSATLTHLPPN